MNKQMRFWNILVIFALLISGLSLPSHTAEAVSTSIVISQVYGGGGNSGSYYKNDFIELFNVSNSSVDITGWSVQYASATGTSWTNITVLSGTIPAGGYYLIQEAAGSGTTQVPLPTPDATGTINMGAAAGKVALVSNSTGLTGTCPTGSLIVDFVGFGSTANCFEGTGPTPAPSNTLAVIRASGGCTDTNENAVDFSTTTPAPRNSATAVNVCAAPSDNAPSVTSTTPADGSEDVALDANIAITFDEAVTAGSDAFDITCTNSLNHTFSLTGADTTDFTLDPDSDFIEGEVCTVTVWSANVNDVDADDPPAGMATDYSFSFLTFMSDPIPTVDNTLPIDLATGVAVADNLSVTFSEVVTVAEGAVAISCAYSGAHNAGVSTSDNITYTIDPDVDFTMSERCAVTLESTLITDSAAQELGADYSWSFITWYDPDAVTPIDVARTYGNGWVGTIEGNVTLTTQLFASRDSFSVQDSTGGMYIYPAYGYTAPPMVLGDLVQVKGTIKNFNGLLEFDPVASVTWIDSGSVPAPLVTATGSVAPTQGKLITVEGTVTIPGTPPVPGANHYTFYINDGSGQVTVYVYKLTNIDMRSFTTGQRMRITGISMAYNNNPQLQPRYQSDLIDLQAPTVLSTVPVTDATNVSLYQPITATFNKVMDLATLTDTSFTLTGPSDAVSGTVSYVAGTKTAVFTPATALQASSFYTAELTTSVTDSYGIPLASPYTWSFTTGEVDSSAPTILTRTPVPSATDVPVSAQVVVAFSEDLALSSLNFDHFVLVGPFGVVPTTFGYDPETFIVTLTPTVSLLYSTEYTMTVTGSTADYAGNPLGSDDTWTFTTMAEPPMQTYFGDLHNHTSYSDGSGSPTQALAAGKAAGFDFMAISDHSYAIDDSEWQNTLDAVNDATGGDFVGLRGFEYTQGAEGHINVWNSTRHATRTQVSGCTFCDYTPNLEAGLTVQGFYPWLVSPVNTPLDDAGEVMQFNHPGWINFNDWFYHPEVSSLARLEEVGNGSGSSYVFSEEEFIRSLDYGWKVGATNNADTHSTEWGINTDNRTGVLMPELTKSALLEALRQRRTFATEDKNFSLRMKANGAWMGSEIANSGTIHFEISGVDENGELATLVELITDQGEVLTTYTPYTSTFTWEPEITISTGVHYYYVKVTQTDGDRIVSSPVWTMGNEDIAITDLRIQPSIPTIHNASLLTVRVTNRVAESRTVSVVLTVNEVQLGDPVEVIVPANGDGYANFSWQPVATGEVTLTAGIQGAPAGDNPDDNTDSLILNVTDELLPLILIDAGHGNTNTAGDEMRSFVNDLSAHNYNVLKNLDALTVEDLNPAVVKLLIITAPQYAYTTEEKTAIGNYVAAGGSLWMGGLADYTGKVPWAATVATRENAILDTIANVTGQTINMRMNDDEVIDGNTNNGYVFGVIWGDFPGAEATGIGMNVEQVSTWSLNSIVDGNKQALTAEDADVQIVMQGDLDTGCTADSWHNPFHTSNTDADAAGDAYIYNPTFTCDLVSPPVGAAPLPGAAVVQLADGAGRIMLYGDSNDPFTIFAYTAGDGKQNELFNLESVMWLLGEPIQKSTIAEARAQSAEDQPDNLDSLVWVEGEITAAYGEFFNVLYVQDSTGGITIHAPAGDIDATTFSRGKHVRVIGTVDIYNGDTEIQFFEAEMVQEIPPDDYDATPTELRSVDAREEWAEGLLVNVNGPVVDKIGADTLIIDDGSGRARVFLDGYNGNFSDIQKFDYVRVVGLVSEDGFGARIRVRNHNFHVGVDDDVIVLHGGYTIYLPITIR